MALISKFQPPPKSVPSHSVSFATSALQDSSVKGFHTGPINGPLVRKKKKATRNSKLQPPKLVAANVSQAFALPVESFHFLLRPKKQGVKFLNCTEAAAPLGEVQKQVGVGERQHLNHLRPQGKALFSACWAVSCSLRSGGTWHFLSKQHFVLKFHKNKFMEMHASFYLPRFSESPN